MGMVTKEGVGGLVDKLAKSGIKEQVMSWVSKGKNLPVNAEQLTSALGAGTISNLVKQTGMDKDSLVQSLVKALPAVIDKVTPDGKVDEKQASSLLKNIDIGKIGGILGGFLKK